MKISEVTYIYALYCPKNKRIKYIGKADNLKGRLSRHINAARKGKSSDRIATWIRELLSEGFRPEIHILMPVRATDRNTWGTFEKFFIASAHYFRIPITNIAKGGFGPACMSHEDQVDINRRIGEGSKRIWANLKHRQRRCLAISKAKIMPNRTEKIEQIIKRIATGLSVEDACQGLMERCTVMRTCKEDKRLGELYRKAQEQRASLGKIPSKLDKIKEILRRVDTEGISVTQACKGIMCRRTVWLYRKAQLSR